MRFAHPHLLWLLLVVPPLLIAFFWWAARRRRVLLTGFIQARLLPDLTAGISSVRERRRVGMIVASVALLIVALTRPQWGFSWEETRQRGLDIVIGLDTSKSMLAEDLPPNRLARAKLAALDLLNVAATDRLGLVAFAGGAFLQCPLTVDEMAFRQSVDALDVNIIPQGGTALAEAIRTATVAFKDHDNFKVLVLFTDGEDHDAGAVEAAREAAEQGMRIFAVGIGTPEGEMLRIRDASGRTDFLRDREGQAVKSRLNENLLQQIASAAQGFYLPLRGANTIETLYEKGLAPLPKSESEARLYKRYHEQFHWPLAAAILLLVSEVLYPARRTPRRSRNAIPQTAAAARNRAAATVLAAVLPLAAWGSPSSAAHNYRSGNYGEALKEYQRVIEDGTDDTRVYFNAGDAAYRRTQFEDAIGLYDSAVKAPDLEIQQQAYYNRGNAFYRLGEQKPDIPDKIEQWEKAVEDYARAMKLDADDADAKFNHDFVKQKLEEIEQQQEQQQDSQDQESQDGEQKDQQGKGDQDQNQESSEQDDSQQQSESGEQESEQSQSDPQEQQQDQQESESQQEQQPQDQQEQPGDQAQSDQGEPEEEEEPQAGQPHPAAPGQMTPEQARALLEGQEGEEKVLPVFMGQPQDRQPPLKDW